MTMVGAMIASYYNYNSSAREPLANERQRNVAEAQRCARRLAAGLSDIARS